MAKITGFTRDNLKELLPEIQAVLDMIKDEYGVALTIGSTRFSAGQFTTKLTGTVEGGTPLTDKKDDHNFAFGALSLGLPEDCQGHKFLIGNRVYRVESINLKRPKYPVVCSRFPDGKKFKFTAATVKMSFSAEEKLRKSLSTP
jgi:hypothetical protein